MFAKQVLQLSLLSISSSSDSPVQTFPTTEEVQVSKVSGPVCGLKAPDSSVKSNPDGLLWRTFQRSLLVGWEPFSGTWPRQGTMLIGTSYQRTRSVSRRSEIESGLEHGETGVPSSEQAISLTANAATVMISGATDASPTMQTANVQGHTLMEMGGSLSKLPGASSPTLTSSEWRGVGPIGSKSQAHMLERGYLGAVVQAAEGMTGKLSPRFCEVWQGFPVDWTYLESDRLDLATPAPPMNLFALSPPKNDGGKNA